MRFTNWHPTPCKLAAYAHHQSIKIPVVYMSGENPCMDSVAVPLSYQQIQILMGYFFSNITCIYFKYLRYMFQNGLGIGQ